MGTITNYVTNPSFEQNISTWLPTAGTSTRDTTTVSPGAGLASLKTIADGSGAFRITHSGITNLVVGATYNYSVWLYTLSTTTVNYYLNLNGGIIGSSALCTTKGRWTRLSMSFIATITNPNLYVRSDSVPVNGDTVWIDRVQVTDGPHLMPTFDGNSPFGAWLGTTNTSSSTLTLANDPATTTNSEMLVLGNLCMNTLAWNLTTRGGRMNVPQKRGSNTIVPTRSGSIFVPNRPYDFNTFVLSMWALGVLPNGAIPPAGDQRRVWEANMATILEVAASDYEPVTAYAWQADGTVRTAQLDLNGTTNVTTMAAARRGEFTLSFDVLDGWWSDWLPVTVTGTAGTAWSSQTLAMPQLAGATAPIDDAVVTVNGAAQNPRLTSVSGVWTQYNATMTGSQSLVIDSGNYTALLNGTSVQTALSRSGNHPRFISIPVKNGVIPSLSMVATGTSANTNLSVTARRHHWSG